MFVCRPIFLLGTAKMFSLLTLFPFDLVAKDEKGKVWPNIHVNNTFFPKHEKKVPKVL